MKAQRLAHKYIRNYYKSYPLARRLHNMLKQYKLIKKSRELNIT